MSPRSWEEVHRRSAPTPLKARGENLERRLRRGPLVLRLALALPLLIAGCSAPSSEAPAPRCTGKCDGPAGAEALVVDVARCWVDEGQSTDPFFRQDALVCEPIASPYARVGFLSVDVITADDDVQGGVLRGTFGAQTIGLLRDGKYPAQVRLGLNLLRGETELVGAELSGELRESFSIASPQALPRTRPFVVRAPVAIWPVRIQAEVDQVILQLDPYKAPLADAWKLGELAEAPVRQSSLPRVRQGQLVSFTLAAPAAETTVAGKGYFLVGSSGREPRPFTIDGPGDFVATANGLRRAQPGELPGEREPDPAPAAPVDMASAD
jgi:hypothetical protein